MTRVTRSSARLASKVKEPAVKATKPTITKSKKKKTATSTKPKSTKPKSTTTTKRTATKDNITSSSGDETGGIIVTIEYCKQWSAFKTRARKIQKGIASASTGAKVEINKEKPGRGNFIIKVGDDKTVINLQGLKRPFKPLKALDMDEVIENVLEAIKDASAHDSSKVDGDDNEDDAKEGAANDVKDEDFKEKAADDAETEDSKEEAADDTKDENSKEEAEDNSKDEDAKEA